MSMWWWSKAKVASNEDRDARRVQKVRDSQQALINAATSTADVAQDVTTKLKERLDDSLRQLEVTAGLLSDSLIIATADGKIESSNAAAERIFGWKKVDLQGKELALLFRTETGSHLSSAQVIDMITHCHEGGLELEDHMECVRGKRRTGELFWVDVNISRVERSDGTWIIILLCRDATKRIETQKQLEANEQRYRGMFEQSLDGIFVVNNHYIVAANPAICRLLGYDAEEMIAKPLTSFFHEDFATVVNNAHTLRLSGDLSPKQYVVKALGRDGTIFDILISSTGMRWNDITCSLMMMKNISDF